MPDLPDRDVACCCSCPATLAVPVGSREEKDEFADQYDWLWNGEEWWCPDCLDVLANEVP